MNDFGRAFGHAFAAEHAFGGIDTGNIAFHLDCAGFTGADAERAAKASGFADKTYIFTAVLAGALYADSLTLGYQSDNILGTDIHAGAAADTFGFIHNGQTVLNMDRTELTGGNTGSEAHTAVRAGLGTRARDHGGFQTMLNTVVTHFVMGMGSVTGTLDISDFFLEMPFFYSKDLGDFVRDGFSTDNAAAKRSFTADDGFCKSITACIAASAAVGAGKNITDQWELRILRHFEFLGHYADAEAENDSQTRQQQKRCQNFN